MLSSLINDTLLNDAEPLLRLPARCQKTVPTLNTAVTQVTSPFYLVKPYFWLPPVRETLNCRLRNAAGVVDSNYWKGTLNPRPVVDW